MITMPRPQVNFAALAGGLDLVSAATLIKPGFALDAQNFEIDSINGGYRRINGFERFDGHSSPTAAQYATMSIILTGTIVVGNTVTGLSSGATAKVLQVNTGQLILGRVVGTFSTSEALQVTGVTQATSTSTAALSGEPTVALHIIYQSLATEDLRLDIAKVPGQGQIRGVFYYAGTTYAFRDAVGGAAGGFYKSTAAGWVAVTLYYEVQFTVGNVATPVDGAVLTQGGVTATVRRVMTRSGAWSGSAVGTLVISAPAGGNFAAGAATLTGGATVTLAGIQTAIALPAGGAYECVQYNFTGSTATSRIYGVSGVGYAFEFDGTCYCPIRTGMTADTPSHIACHKNYLWLSFLGSLQSSGIGAPFAWSVVLGSTELAMGDNITALTPQPGDGTTAVMSVFSQSSTRNLYGPDSGGAFRLVIASPTAGSAVGTAQWIGAAYSFASAGVQQITATLNFGDFQFATVSGMVQPLVNSMQGTAIASNALREKNQYRVYCNDGRVLSMVMGYGANGLQPMGFLPLNYGIPVRCIYTCANTSGREVTFFGSDDGYVYQDNIGCSFDGQVIESWLRLPFNHMKMPRHLKSYYKAALDIVVEQYASLQVTADVDGGLPFYDPSAIYTNAITGKGGYWNQFYWESFSWDSPIVTSFDVTLGGTGKNVSLLIYGSSATDYPYSIQGVSYQFVPRRLER